MTLGEISLPVRVLQRVYEDGMRSLLAACDLIDLHEEIGSWTIPDAQRLLWSPCLIEVILIPMSDVTHILSQIETGDQKASEELLPLVYDELRKLAAARMANERVDHTLQSTAIVHEAYLQLVDVDSVKHWDSRGHFFAAAAEAMRRILVDHARTKAMKKRDARFDAVEVTNLQDQSQTLTAEQLLDLNDALQKLEREDPLVAELVRLRVFAGLSMTEAARVIKVSRSAAYAHWDFALAWFAAEMPA